MTVYAFTYINDDGDEGAGWVEAGSEAEAMDMLVEFEIEADINGTIEFHLDPPDKAIH